MGLRATGLDMDRIFAPWRIEWVERDGSQDPDAGEACPFCALPAADDDRANRVVARSESAFVLLNNYPYNPGHCMVIPYDHEGDYRALDPATLADHARLKQRTLDALEAALSPDAFNVGYNLGGSPAGGSIDDHLHAHVVPRWEGDTSFMPVLSETTVIVQALEETYDRLHGAFAALDAATAPDEDDAVRFDDG
jgi:ATP adenylyltransferase